MQLFDYIESFVSVILLEKGQEIPGIGPCGTMLPGGYKVGAAYNRDLKTIWLCSSKNTVAYKHELSHHAWFYMLSQEEINKYTVAWESSKKVGPHIFNRDYGTQNVWEGFADDMSFIATNTYEDRASNSKDRSIRNKRIQVIKSIIKRLTRLAKNK